MTRSETEVRRTAPGRGTRPARVPRATPRGRRPIPAAAGPVAAQATPVQAGQPGQAGQPTPAARRSRAPRAPFVLLVVGLLCGGLVSLLLLSAVLAQDSYRVGQLGKDISELRAVRESKKSENMRQDMPGVLARNNELQGQQDDWNTARVIIPGGPADRAADGNVAGSASADRGAGDGEATAGRERVPGTGR
ncbi:hypothetical protein [Streptosporangium sp. DT93]|uniref:hypothetical protein n=1 Tax=Streptosporangium sp. DT93 TaxID=3393428 RepID=UPI003CF0FF77